MNEQELAEIKERYAKLGDEDANVIHRLLEKIDWLIASLHNRDVILEVYRIEVEQLNKRLINSEREVDRLRAALENALRFAAQRANHYWIHSAAASDFEKLAKMISEALKGGSQSTCKWQLDPDHEISTWNTSCGEAFGFSECTPKEAGCIYCTHCGKPIDFVEQEGGEG